MQKKQNLLAKITHLTDSHVYASIILSDIKVKVFILYLHVSAFRKFTFESKHINISINSTSSVGLSSSFISFFLCFLNKLFIDPNE